jgi:hypothetical protein
MTRYMAVQRHLARPAIEIRGERLAKERLCRRNSAVTALAADRSPIAAILLASIATSPAKLGEPVPSMMIALRRIMSCFM